MQYAECKVTVGKHGEPARPALRYTLSELNDPDKAQKFLRENLCKNCPGCPIKEVIDGARETVQSVLPTDEE